MNADPLRIDPRRKPPVEAADAPRLSLAPAAVRAADLTSIRDNAAWVDTIVAAAAADLASGRFVPESLRAALLVVHERLMKIAREHAASDQQREQVRRTLLEKMPRVGDRLRAREAFRGPTLPIVRGVADHDDRFVVVSRRPLTIERALP